MAPACSRPRTGDTGGQQPLRGLNSSRGATWHRSGLVGVPQLCLPAHWGYDRQPPTRREIEEPDSSGVSDNAMPRRSPCSGTATLTRGADLAVPAAACQKAVREQQNPECLDGMRRPDQAVRAHFLVRGRWHASLNHASWVAPWLTTCAMANRPSDLAATFWLSCAGAGCKCWERQPRHHPRGPASTCSRRGEPLWEIGMPSPFAAPTALVFTPCHSDEQSRYPAPPFTCLAGLWNDASAEENLRSSANCWRPKRTWATTCSSTLWTNSRDTRAWTTSWCPNMPSSPSSNRTEVRNIDLSGTFCGQRSTPRCPSAAKHRLVWDLLSSDVSSSLSLPERVVLPRLEDAVEDGEHLLRVHGPRIPQFSDPSV